MAVPGLRNVLRRNTFDGRSLFFVSSTSGGGSGQLYELDPATGAVRDVDLVGAGSLSFDGLATVAGLVYVQDSGTSDLHVFDPLSDTLVTTLDIDVVNPGVLLLGGVAGATHPTRLVATNALGALFEIDPTSGVAAPLSSGTGLPQGGVGTTDGVLWTGDASAGGGSRLTLLGDHGGTLNQLPGTTGFAALGADDVFLGRIFAFPLDGSQQIAELDPRTGLELRRIAAPEPNSSLDAALAFDGRSLWFISGAIGGGSGLLFELDPADGRVRRTFPPPAPPTEIDGLAALGGLLYISDNLTDDILVYDPLLGGVVNVLDIDLVNPGADIIGGIAGIHWPAAIIATGPAVAYEIDPSSGVISNTMAVPIPLAGGVAVADGVLFFGDLLPATGMDLRVFTRQGIQLRSFTSPYGYGGLAGDDSTLELRWLIFADGFESGDTTRWSATSP